MKTKKLIKEEWICSLAEVIIEGLEIDIIKIEIARKKNKETIKVVKGIQKIGVKVLREDEWQIEKYLVLKEEKIYMSKNKELRVEIIQLHHNMLVAGHK